LFLNQAGYRIFGRGAGRKRILLLLLLGSASVLFPGDHPASRNSPRILIINSYHHGYRFSDDIVRVFREDLKARLPDADIRLEYMDTKRYDGRAHFELFYSYLSRKYAGERFDLIMVSDDPAFLFIREFQTRLWSDTPVVFSGLNHFEPEMLQEYPHHTGIIEKSDIEDNVRLIESLHPDARTLYLIIDNTITGEALRKSESETIRQITRFEVRFLDGGEMNLDELLFALERLPRDAVVVYQLWQRDRSMRRYEHEEVLPLICRHASVPVYGFSDIYLGLGIVGGKLISGREQGEVAADMTLRILSGTDPGEIPVQLDSCCKYRFDDRALRRFHIPDRALPSGSEILYRSVSFYSRHKKVIWFFIGIVGIQFILIFYLLISRRKLAATERALKREHRLLQALMDTVPDHIYFKDRQSRFIRNNRSHLQSFGFERQEDALGRTDFDFFRKEFAEEAFQDEQKIMETGEPIINKVEKIRKGDKDFSFFSSTKMPIRDEEGNVAGIMGISRDISRNMEDSQKIRNALAEKEVLLKEIHHRVKNNLQIISSLLNLQMATVGDKNLQDVFREAQSRVRSMALIHESLYQGEDVGRLDMKSYVRTLINGLHQSFQGISGRVNFQMSIQDIPIPIDLAVPGGLILNELVSNVLKHAFPDKKVPASPEVRIRLEMDENGWILMEVSDNGKGMPVDFDWKNTDSLGLKLVRILTENQLRGILDITGETGTRIEVRFPVEGSPEILKAGEGGTS